MCYIDWYAIWYHTLPPWYLAAMPLWLVRSSPLSENRVPTTLSILHWLNTFCCTRQLGTFIFPPGYQSSRLQAAEIDRGRHLLRMDKISRLQCWLFFVAEAARHSVAPTDSIEEHLCVFIDIFNNLLDSNLSKVSTDAKSNPESIKPKRRECPIARTTTYVSTVRITNLRSPCRAQCATWNRMRVFASSWEHGWRYSTSLTSFCVETIVSSSVLMITLLPVSHACMQSDR